MLEETFILYLVLILAILLGALVVWQFRSKARRSRSDFEKTLDTYQESHPDFYRIMELFDQRKHGPEFLANLEIEQALRALERGKSPRRKSPSGSFLDLSDSPNGGQQAKVEAAMLTILRKIYLDEKLRADMPPAADRQLDELLDQFAEKGG